LAELLLLLLLVLFAGWFWFAGVVSRHGRLSAAAGWLSGRFCAADCCGAWAVALLASAAVLLSTRDAKMSLPCDWPELDLAAFAGVFGKDALVAASDVTLCTDGLSQ
jgi:hypothetical protein